MYADKIRPEPDRKYRLLTRSDMDGLVCAVILKELDLVDEVVFVHPKDMQDGLVEVSKNDITTNLPYVEGVYICFDHHSSEVERVREAKSNHIIDASQPSAARVVYNYFNGKNNPKLDRISDAMMHAVDKSDSASYTREEILDPKGWVLLGFLMDARTGLGRFREFRISNYQLMMDLIDYCRTCQTIEEILSLPDVKERVDLYFAFKSRFREQIERCSTIYKNLVVLDLRDEDQIWPGNRFLIYAIFPTCNISMHVLWGKERQNTVLAVGKSVLNRSSRTHVGKLMLEYGGGGHENAGTCQIENDVAEEKIDEIIARITKEG